MLNENDILRARFAPGDRVLFSFRNREPEGILVRANPKRAVIRVAEEEYHVPYECLQALHDTGRERVARLRHIQETADSLLRAHGLQRWSFQFDHGTRRAGCCYFRERLICISINLALQAEDADIEETLLHEIAHALVGRRHSHDAVWQAKAREIGCSGERCHHLQFAPPRYSVTCENRCWTHTAERRTARLICRTCGGKVLYSPYPAHAGSR